MKSIFVLGIAMVMMAGNVFASDSNESNEEGVLVQVEQLKCLTANGISLEVLPAPAGSTSKLVRSKWFGTVRNFTLGLTHLEKHTSGEWLRIALMDVKNPEKTAYDVYLLTPKSEDQESKTLGGFLGHVVEETLTKEDGTTEVSPMGFVPVVAISCSVEIAN